MSPKQLLGAILAASTDTTTTRQLGPHRDLIRAVAQGAAGYRNRHRMGDDATLRVLMPSWSVDALIADVAIGEQASADLLRRSRAQVVAILANLGVNVTFSSTRRPVSVRPSSAQSAGALDPFPDTVHWFLFHEGMFTFLDGGTLDLGDRPRLDVEHDERLRDVRRNVRGCRRGRTRECPRRVADLCER
ncbi:MAG: major capsid protein [Acidimicrobiia bacterium]|nr:major capsid protein [Acidimicrobiia bacterium]